MYKNIEKVCIIRVHLIFSTLNKTMNNDSKVSDNIVKKAEISKYGETINVGLLLR